MPRLAEDDLIDAYRAHLRPLYGWVQRRSGGDRELAEDVVQETWLRAVGRWRGRGLPRDPQAWLRTVARRVLFGHYRRRRPEPLDAGELDLEHPGEPRTPNAAVVLHRALARLRRGQARLLEAHHLEGRDTASLAAELRLSERAVEGRLRRSRQALRACLEPWIRDTGGTP